jgi:hypothetical protein
MTGPADARAAATKASAVYVALDRNGVHAVQIVM